jgi:DMSO/TMAO reductase YedYZ heme-binding membrane subunit
LAAVGVTLALTLVFWMRTGAIAAGDDLTQFGYGWNIALADTSFVLLCLILMLAAVARYVPRLRRLVPWNRELGIGMFVTASLHVVILLDYSVGNQSLFSFENLGEAFFRRSSGYLVGDSLWTAANWVGLFALGYALVLAATSNDLSQRLLGRGWKFTQRQTYTLFVLTWLHTAAFLVDLDRFPPALTWFWMFTILAVVAQMSGFVHTVRSTRGPSPQRAPNRMPADTSKAAAVAAAKWVAVVALWGLLIIGIYVVASVHTGTFY